MSAVLPLDRIERLTGFGFDSAADGYVFRPTSVDQINDVFLAARRSGRRVVLRGAGRSYGDASIGAECLVIDITRMNRVLNWDSKTGLLEAEGGVTIEQMWRLTLEDGWWPPVVSGTMYPTLAGALAMNIHGKNNRAAGPIGEHVTEIDVLFPTGELKTLTPADELFFAVIGGFGTLGVIVRVVLRLKKVHSGELRVLPLACANWDEQFDTMRKYEHDADYLVSWVDCFGRGKGFGRGMIHAAWYTEEEGQRPASLRPSAQDLPDTILGFFPKSIVWRYLRRFNNRPGMHFVNWAKHVSGALLGNGRPISQSLVAFSFLLDYVPNWRNAYLPGGFIQYQSFVPKERAAEVFARQVEMQQEAKLEANLGVLKRHRPDRFLFSHAVDGYSLALDFNLTERNRARLYDLAHRMNDVVLEAHGRFYFAKDSTLRPSDVRAYLGPETLATYREMKHAVDPDVLLTNALAERLELVPRSGACSK